MSKEKLEELEKKLRLLFPPAKPKTAHEIAVEHERWAIRQRAINRNPRRYR